MLDTKLGHVFVFCCADVVFVIVVDDASNSGAAQVRLAASLFQAVVFFLFSGHGQER